MPPAWSADDAVPVVRQPIAAPLSASARDFSRVFRLALHRLPQLAHAREQRVALGGEPATELRDLRA